MTSLTASRKPSVPRTSSSEKLTRSGEEDGKGSATNLPETAPFTTDWMALLVHELHAPLQAMVAWLEVLKTSDGHPDKSPQALAAIERCIASQRDLLEKVGTIGELLRNELTLELAGHDCAKLVAEVVESLAPSARGRIELRIERSDNPIVMAEAPRLKQTIRNLLENAIKFSPAESLVKVVVGGNEAELEIAVSDEGSGFTSEVAPCLFERFFQAQPTAPKQGLGLGLYITRMIVEAHRGSVSAESDGLGKGATFRIRLPLAPSESAVPEGRAQG
jgi:signal transduction histidine kinase